MAVFTTLADLASAPFRLSRTTRNKVSDVDRARLAKWYVIQVVGGDRNPARTLADRYPETSVKTWANHFTRLRSLSPPMLTDAPRRGVAGGVLTEHAERLLDFPPEAPAVLENVYRAGRETYPAPVRRDKRTAMPVRSKFASDADYEREFNGWAEYGWWFTEVEVGPEGVEDFEDWWNRMIQNGRGD